MGALPGAVIPWRAFEAPTPDSIMCRNIRTLANFEPPATADEVHAAALQFVRKLSGMHAPSKANADAFDGAVEEVAAAARTLLSRLEIKAPPKDRATEAAKARARGARLRAR